MTPAGMPSLCTCAIVLIVLKVLDQTSTGNVIVDLLLEPATMKGLQNFKPKKQKRVHLAMYRRQKHRHML